MEVVEIISRGLFVFGSALSVSYWFFRRQEVEVIWALSLFLALLASQVTFWLCVLLRLSPSSILLFLFYGLILIGIAFGIHGPMNGAKIIDYAEGKRRSYCIATIETALIFLFFAAYYTGFSRGIPTSGGFYFFHLDLLKFAEETGSLYPQLPGGITFTNYVLTILVPHYPLLFMLGYGVGFSGHVIAYGLIHGIYSCGFGLMLVALYREFTGSRYWGYLGLLLLFVGIGGTVYSNQYITRPSKELGIYFLLSLASYYLVKLFREKPKQEDFAVFLLVAIVTVLARPYTFPFLASFGFMVTIYFIQASPWNDLLSFIKLKSVLFALVTPIIGFLYIVNYIKFGSAIPFGRIHSSYSMDFSWTGFGNNLIETVRLFMHYYFPYIEAAFFRSDSWQTYEYIEVSLFVSLLGAIGLGFVCMRMKTWFQRRNQFSASMVFVGLVATFCLTAIFLVPKNRMFYWFTPFILVLAIEGVRGSLALKWKALIPTIVVLGAITIFVPSHTRLVSGLKDSVRVRLPHQIGPSYFSSAIEVMHLIREAVCRHPDGKIMVTGLEPGLEDFVLTPGKYYWEAVGFPQDTEQVFDKLKWDSDKCINWLRENNIKIISVNVAYGASICFLREKENSERFWKLIDGNPQVFKRIGSPKGRFKYRTVYEIL